MMFVGSKIFSVPIRESTAYSLRLCRYYDWLKILLRRVISLVLAIASWPWKRPWLEKRPGSERFPDSLNSFLICPLADGGYFQMIAFVHGGNGIDLYYLMETKLEEIYPSFKSMQIMWLSVIYTVNKMKLHHSEILISS